MNRFIIALTGLCAFSVVLLASCDPPSPGQQTTVSDGKPTVGVIACKSAPFWESVEFGAGNSADMNELQLHWQIISDTDDFDQQASAIHDLTIRRVKGIIIATQHELLLRDAVKRATDQGIHILMIDSPPRKHVENLLYPLSIVTTDQYHAGQLAADELARQLEEKGRVAIIRYSPSSWKTESREKGFLAQIKNYPEIDVVGHDLYTGTDSRLAREKLTNFLRLYLRSGRSDLDGIFISEESTACEILFHLEQANLGTHIYFVAFGSDPRLITGMLTYQIDALFVEKPVRMGQLAVDSMAELLRGQTIATYIDSGVHCITIDNLSSPFSQALLHPTTEISLEIQLNEFSDSVGSRP